MPQVTLRLTEVANRLDALSAERRTLLAQGLSCLELAHPALAEVLLAKLGGHERAAAWMCIRQRALEGQTAWQAVAVGGTERLWALLEGHWAT